MRVMRERKTSTKLTARQQSILDYIGSQPKRPTYRAISAHFGIQVSAAYAHVQKIKAKGFL